MDLFPYEMSLLKSVDNVMSDRPALEAFIEWIRLDPLRIDDSVDLYFALKSFRELRDRNKQETAKLACQLHRKYISLRTGSCSFLAESVRQAMSDRIHSLPKDVKLIPKDLFNVVEAPLMEMISDWHADFVLSDQFAKISFSDSPSPSASDVPFGDDVQVNCVDSDEEIFDLNESPQPPKKESRSQSISQVGVASTSGEQDPPLAPPLQEEDEVINFRRETGSEESETGSSGLGIDSRLRTDCSSLLEEEKKAREQMDIGHRTADSHPHRHDKPENRLAFAAELGNKLQLIAERKAAGQDSFARDLPLRDTSFSSRSDRSAARTGRDMFAVDPDEGDFMVDKYVEKMEAKMNKKNRSHSRRRDHSTPNTFMNPMWSQCSGAQFPEQDFGLTSGMQSATLMNNGYRTYNTLQYPSYKRQGSAFTGSSGFCSGESTFYGDRSFDSQRAPYNNSSASFGSGYSSTMSRRQPQGFAPPPQQNVFATLPRRPIDPITRSKCILRWEGEAAPYVAHLTGTNIRLAEFRQTFGVSRRDNLRLFFKSPCEDSSAPYQWTIITDDDQILPVFEEKITAEARKFMD